MQLQVVYNTFVDQNNTLLPDQRWLTERRKEMRLKKI